MHVHHALAERAARTPHAPALIADDAELSYAQLRAAALRIAAQLRAGVPDDAPLRRHVVVCMQKSALAVAAIYGVLLAGGSYVPVEADLPAERLAHILRETDCLCVLVDAAGAALAAAADAERPRLRLDAGTLFDADADAASMPAASLRCSDGDAAAVLFTSGSTGLPKGALITHGNLRAFVAWAVPAFGLHAGDRLASHASFSFDLSFFDLYAAAAAGASVALVPASASGSGALLMQFVQTRRPTVWQSVPSALGLMQVHASRHAMVADGVRLVLFAGERMPVPRLKSLLGVFPAAEHVNVYGCTETNDSFFYRVPRHGEIPDPLPIGRLIDGMAYRVLDENGAAVAPGSPGMLWVAGPTLMAGYLRREHDAAAFREWPLATGGTRRFYGTRDQVVEHADGDLRFLGRVDGVVKVSGFRVSLQEIEDRIAECELVDEVAVLAVADERLGHRMVAVVRHGPQRRPSTLDMKLYCSRRMARYMVPQSFVFSTEPLPKSKNGKVDKKRLAADHATCTHPQA